nr:PREDICTED: 60S ribosomal protein L18a-like protein isoform X2 [Musa acuminata subsp. malaccensis]
MLMAGRGSDADRTKVPAVQPPSTPPPYSTFSQLPPTAPLVYPPAVPHHQPTPQTTSGYHVIPVGYQSHLYPTFVDGIPMAMRDPPLPFCGIGIGWALFVSGFFLASIPWYVGVFILLFVATDYREKPRLVACTVAAVLALIPLILNAFKFHVFW